jgi:hypothetical protein
LSRIRVVPVGSVVPHGGWMGLSGVF